MRTHVGNGLLREREREVVTNNGARKLITTNVGSALYKMYVNMFPFKTIEWFNCLH